MLHLCVFVLCVRVSIKCLVRVVCVFKKICLYFTHHKVQFDLIPTRAVSSIMVLVQRFIILPLMNVHWSVGLHNLPCQVEICRIYFLPGRCQDCSVPKLK